MLINKKSNDFTEQFKKLQEVAPSLVWKENTRDFLVNQAKLDFVVKEHSWLQQLQTAFFIFCKRTLPSPVKTFGVFLILILIGGTGAFAKAQYNPKSLLYPVKITLEKIDLVLAFTSKSEAKKYLDYANLRQEEALKLAKETGFSAAEREEGINTIIKSMEKNINAAQNSLAVIKENKDKSTETVELAKEISQKTDASIKGLNEVNSIVQLNGIKSAISEAQSAIEQAEDASLEVLIKEAGKDDNQNSTVSKDELNNIINKKIQRAQEKIDTVNEIINNIDVNQFIIDREITQGTTKIKISLNIKEMAQEARDLTNSAQKLVDAAAGLLRQDLFVSVLENIKTASADIESVKQILAKVESPEELQEIDAPAGQTETSQQPTTTKPGITVEGVTEEINETPASTTPETTVEIMQN